MTNNSEVTNFTINLTAADIILPLVFDVRPVLNSNFNVSDVIVV